MRKSHIGSGDADHICIRGHDLADDLLDKHDFVDVLCLAILGHFPDPRLRRMINNALVASIDHGLTPSALATRLTLHGAPESLQGAVAAGLLGAGTRFLGSAEASAHFLRTALDGVERPEALSDAELGAHAHAVVARCRAQGQKIPGLGHPIHVHADPRTERALRIAREDGYFGVHCRFALQLAAALAHALGRPMPLNAAGCKGAVLLDLGLTPEFGKGLALIGRVAGLVAHAIEERSRPLGQDLWNMASAASQAGEE
ncbi:citryl-CoA lyase [Verminephrobacter aporrectodeae subsp. tuberculatae]|uniref:citryl-CoA lyase n=1 Tax=Verminephrobacter aporrectodeae TaxID=1110389 RepID=UPI00023765CC|nr:citryl-CoA lyase [Verminephrobacter aporrectodeae]MCW5222640.1 citryl-CoA lyase [Verminephrobacter aporrectodeae subsp. tuberculatae]MCW5257128.1 citryl-CoA lyase [Verminephrobacter aporrectodeae subsp. tuberculatae]MCW5288104.1 citryl-CoA lyase [Verminephrobacter aporrectodeae subsp. tuberculatae]MCW8164270.1 citryl-CoA lyase [Verminephrobacter aporrectodeae subsp. tuberculatae]MCW8168794.1 citryl-CoA lyase [Verminephrobacter aporrectodeae subsp. tuberculatae]